MVGKAHLYMMKTQTVSTDNKGRLNLGAKFARKEFKVTARADGTLILEPSVTVVVPEREAWLFTNPEAMASLKRGIEQAKAGKVKPLPSETE